MKNNIWRVTLSIIIVLLLSLSNSLVSAATPCLGDLDHDGDVDGTDLSILLTSGGLDLGSFASEFGSSDCVLEAQITLSPRVLRRTAIQGLNPDLDLQSFTVRNTGNSTLEYNITDDAGWLDVSPVAGSLNSGETEDIPVQFDVVAPTALDQGTYHAVITVSGTTPLTGEPVPDRTVDVTLTVISSAAQFIIDNDDPGTSYSGDDWGYSSGEDPYGGSSRAASAAGAIYTFQGSVAGQQKISLWWTWFSSRCIDVPVDIYDGTTLLDTVEVDQQDQDLDGQWNLLGLGTYPFSGTARVVVKAQDGCSACADAVKFEYITSDPFVVFTAPQNYDLQTSPDLYVFASAKNLEAGWGVKFVLDMGTVDETVIFDHAEPHEGVFSGLTQAEHTLDAYVVDGSESTVPGPFTHDQKIRVGIGNYYVAVGDSITEGYGDDDPSDDISLDGRNAGGGYEPILNNLLTSASGIPHTIVNEGVGGWESLDGVGAISAQLSRHPGSQRFLVQYGTNDSDPYLPIPSGRGLSPGDSGYPGTFKENMQIIIDAINADGKEVCLSKLPITLGDTPSSTPYPNPDLGRRNTWIKEYNDVIDELKDDPLNDITIIPPDLYSLFNEDVTGGKRYDFEYWDNLHPDGTGYRSMANQWRNAIAP